jgi:hypothetical protein
MVNNLPKKQFDFYLELLPIAYEIYKIKTDGFVCGAEAQNIRDELFAYIQSKYFVE